jgi:hypothetical protein
VILYGNVAILKIKQPQPRNTSKLPAMFIEQVRTFYIDSRRCVYNDVPYPVVISKDNVHFLLEMEYIPRELFPKIKDAEFEDAYSYYFGDKDEDE